MARKDRTYTEKDIIRLWCYNLSDDERMKVFLRFRYLDWEDICIDDARPLLTVMLTCETIRELRDVMQTICSFRQWMRWALRTRGFFRFPLLRVVIAALDKACLLQGYLDFLLDTYCRPRRLSIPELIKQIPNVLGIPDLDRWKELPLPEAPDPIKR